MAVRGAVTPLTLPSRGRFPAYGLQAPLMSNVGHHESGTHESVQVTYVLRNGPAASTLGAASRRQLAHSRYEHDSQRRTLCSTASLPLVSRYAKLQTRRRRPCAVRRSLNHGHSDAQTFAAARRARVQLTSPVCRLPAQRSTGPSPSSRGSAPPATWRAPLRSRSR
jgi:hypothetical protein